MQNVLRTKQGIIKCILKITKNLGRTLFEDDKRS